MTETEARLYQMIGQQHARVQQLEAAYAGMIDVLAKVVSGEIDRSRVMVNLTEGTCAWAPEGFRPEMPATINGLPVCVVAPAEPEAEGEKTF